MLDNLIYEILHVLIPLCELIGITVVAISAIGAFIKYLVWLFTHKKMHIKHKLAGGLALSLEFKMAAEILKTVLIHDLSELVILGIVIALRAVLAVLIHFEMKHDEDDD